jgi:hypothetical protein
LDYDAVADNSDHGNKSSNCLRVLKFLDQPKDNRLFKNNSTVSTQSHTLRADRHELVHLFPIWVAPAVLAEYMFFFSLSPDAVVVS